MGKLSDDQKQWLRDGSRRLLRSDQVWLKERAQWLTELGILLTREPGWQERVRVAVSAKNKHTTPEYQRVYDPNMYAIYELIA